jgi:hypothetical protein
MILVKRCKGNRVLGRIGIPRQYNINVGVKWTHLVEDRDKWIL